MEINQSALGEVMKNILSDLEKKVKDKTPVDTGSLKNSIKLTMENGTIVFRANNYGKFQDEGTMRNKVETDISKKIWPRYKPKGSGRNGNGIKGKHFTNPLSDMIDMISSGVVEFIGKEMVDEITREVKKEDKE